MRSHKLLIVGLLVVAAGIAALTLTGCQKKVSEEVVSYSTPEQEKLLGNILDTLTFQ